MALAWVRSSRDGGERLAGDTSRAHAQAMLSGARGATT